MRYIPLTLAPLLLAAHFLRSGNYGLAAACAFLPLVLFIKRAWVPIVGQGLTLAGTLVWVNTAASLVSVRRMIGESWVRLAIIMGVVTLFTAATALIYRSAKMQSKYQNGAPSRVPAAAAFFLTALLLGFVQVKVALPMLILERFLPGGGRIEVFGFAVYAAVITEKMLDVSAVAKWRKRIWLLFSAFFFAQFIIGLLGLEAFLLTGELHIPVPALIAAGPLYRGEGLFMPILFTSTVVLVGPAWCSHLCYIGSWDLLASAAKRKPKALPRSTSPIRIGILVLVIGVAFLLRAVGASFTVAAAAAIGFGLVGVAIMLFWSRSVGVMTHCVVFCPIGLLANLLGKISPFRIRLMAGCTECGKCTKTCRYDALCKKDIEKRKPSITCTLCGDCLGACSDAQIEYRFGPLKGEQARRVFLVLVVSLHAVFMAVARI